MTKWFDMNLISWMILIMIIASLLTTKTHPVLIILMIMVFNIFLCFSMSMWKMSFIFPIMFFLMMISGLLIIFLYFSSLISNEKIQSNWCNNYHTLLIILIITPPLIKKFNLMMSLDPMNPECLESFLSSKTYTLSHWIKPMFSPPLMNMTLMCMILLLMIMIAVIKMCTPNAKALRKLN